MAAAFLSSPCNSIFIRGCVNINPSCTKSFLGVGLGQRLSDIFSAAKRNRIGRARRFSVLAATEESRKSEESVPSWARPESDEPPPWARDEGRASAASKQSFEIPFYVYLLASSITAIAAIGSVFEYVNKKPVFGVLNSDSIFYAPLLGFFAFTGIPTSAFLWFKSVQAANKEAEEQDKRDGYL